ncbi:MAG: caspase family protein [Acidobacteriota bacterium]|nr:caspase family protein [Acidobacteriota bacterium]
MDVGMLFQYAADKVPELALHIGGIQRPVIISPKGQSFDIGMLTQSDRAAIPLGAVKPLLSRPILLNADEGYDNLGLTAGLELRLSEEAKSKKTFILIGTEEFPGALRVLGTYSIQERKIKLTLNLIRDNVKIASIPVYGSIDDLERLTSQIIDVIVEAVGNLSKSSPQGKVDTGGGSSALATFHKGGRHTLNTSSVDSLSLNHRRQTSSSAARRFTSGNYRLSSHSTSQKRIEIILRNAGAERALNLQQDKPQEQSIVIVRPRIKNAKDGAGDSLKIGPEVVKLLKQKALDSSQGKSSTGHIEFRDVDDAPGAIRLEGQYEIRGEKYYHLRLSVWRDQVTIAEIPLSMCGECNSERLAEMFVDMTLVSLSNNSLSRGTVIVRSPAEAAILNKKFASHALLIGFDDYDELGHLNNPLCDALTLGRELELNYGFKVTPAFNQDLNGVSNAIDSYRNVVKDDEDDQLLIFIAGHGFYDEKKKRGFLAVRNSKKDDANHFSYYPFSSLIEDIESLPFKHILVIVDSCFSGAIIQSGSRSGDFFTEPEAIAARLQNKTRWVITSGSLNYVDDGPKGEHSPFARQLLEAFRKYDRILDIHKLWTYGDLKMLRQKPTEGYFGDNQAGSDFLFIRKGTLQPVECQTKCKCEAQ